MQLICYKKNNKFCLKQKKIKIKNLGSAFTLRGCAENFGAIDEKLFADGGDNTCKKYFLIKF